MTVPGYGHAISGDGFGQLWDSVTTLFTESLVKRLGSSSYRVYGPSWLPRHFHRVSIPRGPLVAKLAILKLYQKEFTGWTAWFNVLEGPADCCSHHVSGSGGTVVHLSGGRTAHYSYVGSRLGGRYLMWKQGKTYISISSPGLDRKTMVHIADSFAATATVRPAPR
jgi:hypothetical protein